MNHQSGPGKNAPLHMAARRGHSFIAELLLNAGADLEIKDAKGETPLRRAVNCRKLPMAIFLLSRGANTHSPDHAGTTPLDAAKTDDWRAALTKPQ